MVLSLSVTGFLHGSANARVPERAHRVLDLGIEPGDFLNDSINQPLALRLVNQQPALGHRVRHGDETHARHDLRGRVDGPLCRLLYLSIPARPAVGDIQRVVAWVFVVHVLPRLYVVDVEAGRVVQPDFECGMQGVHADHGVVPLAAQLNLATLVQCFCVCDDVVCAFDARCLADLAYHIVVLRLPRHLEDRVTVERHAEQKDLMRVCLELGVEVHAGRIACRFLYRTWVRVQLDADVRSLESAFAR